MEYRTQDQPIVLQSTARGELAPPKTTIPQWSWARNAIMGSTSTGCCNVVCGCEFALGKKLHGENSSRFIYAIDIGG